MQDISNTTLQLFKSGRKTKSNPSGWTSGNAPCCIHNGESADTRGRGGVHVNSDGSVSYSCFNCKFKASYQPGRLLSFKFKKLLRWLGCSDSELHRLSIEALKLKDAIGSTVQNVKEQITLKSASLPQGSVSFLEVLDYLEHNPTDNSPLLEKINYVVSRGIDINKYNFYLSDQKINSMHNRIIIPCYYKGKLIGYNSRATDNSIQPKYFDSIDKNYVFNLDNQPYDNKVVIVCEGAFDAMSIDGVALLGSTCNETQAELIEDLNKEIIVIADRDSAGAKLINKAIEYGWGVSFPIWLEDPETPDVNSAVVKYGKLFVLKTIISSRETNKLKIELHKRRLY
jgi:hypothetical protein